MARRLLRQSGMRNILLSLLLLGGVARADERLDLKLDLQKEVKQGKAMAAVGTILIAGGIATGIACAVITAGVAGDGLGEHYYYASHPDQERDATNAIITTCTLHPALLGIGIPLTAVGAHKAKRADKVLRFGLNGVSGTF